MRLLRLLALAGVLLLAYFAQYLFDHGTLSSFYPAWALDRLPFLQVTTIWLADDLYTLGLWLFALAVIIFGLLAPPLPPPSEARICSAVTPALAVARDCARCCSVAFGLGLDCAAHPD